MLFLEFRWYFHQSLFQQSHFYVIENTKILFLFYLL